MQTHIRKLTKQRLSDFFVKEEGHVAHKNALVAGTVATGAILASMLLTPDTADAHHQEFYPCGTGAKRVWCIRFEEDCRSRFRDDGEVFYECVPI